MTGEQTTSFLTDLLRDPQRIADRCRDERDLREVTIISLACITIGAAVFGGVVGSFRGGMQITYSAIKLPLALITTLVFTVPALYGFSAGLDRPASLRSLTALTLAAMARSALMLVAVAPLLWLAVDQSLGYHGAVLITAALYGVSGLTALGLLLRGLGDGMRRLALAVALVAVFFVVGGQGAWMLRPFLGRPAHTDVPFLRAREGTFADSLHQSAWSSLGIYRRLPEVSPETSMRRIQPTDADVADITRALDPRTPLSGSRAERTTWEVR